MNDRASTHNSNMLYTNMCVHTTQRAVLRARELREREKKNTHTDIGIVGLQAKKEVVEWENAPHRVTCSAVRLCEYFGQHDVSLYCADTKPSTQNPYTTPFSAHHCSCAHKHTKYSDRKETPSE